MICQYKKLIKLLKKLGKAIFYPNKLRSKENNVWEKIEKKQAKYYFDRGLYSLEEYNRKIEEINRKQKYE